MRRRHGIVLTSFLPALAHLMLLHAVAGEPIVLRPKYDTTRAAPLPFGFPRELKRPHVALVLTGGGARGVAQIGALRVMERHRIPIDFIAATSMGAIVGGLYASGYTVAEIESLALNTPWDDVLSLTEETKRRELFVDQKIAGDRSFLAVRFQGFTPVLPPAVSSGQRLTDFLNAQVLQALYHPIPDFDHLKIPFRAVATDIVSGNRAVLGKGSLAEALRASATVPLLFNPIEKDSMQLVDGGLVANIPVDVARERGYDIIVVVNSTSGLRTPEEMKAPWQKADQIMSIMMRLINERQLGRADVVITPVVGKHSSSDFHGLDTLIRAGEAATEARIPDILALYERKLEEMQGGQGDSLMLKPHPTVTIDGGPVSDSLRVFVEAAGGGQGMAVSDVRQRLDALYTSGDYRDVEAEILADSTNSRIRYALVPNPVLTSIRFEGARLMSDSSLLVPFAPLIGRPVNPHTIQSAAEGAIRLYRTRGYSLARIDTMMFEAATGLLRVRMNEGIIHAIEVQGGDRTQDAFVLREFPLAAGEVFQIDRARRGVTNVNSTTLFEYVYLEVTYNAGQPVLTIRLKERPSQLVRFGLRADSERSLQGLIDIRDENFQGSGMDLGLTVAGGDRNLDAVLEYKARRLFDSYLTVGVGGFYRMKQSYLYADNPSSPPNRWYRDRVGEYREARYGATVSFGSQLERLGNASVELILQNVRVTSLDRADVLEESYRLNMIRLGTVIDTKDRFPFPTVGVGLDLSYEFAFEGIGSERSYNALRVMYETYSTWGVRHTLHPRFTMGFADKTMPFAQQFRLGGRDNFFGLREDDRRGRQLLLLNLEYRYFVPFRILFDAYLRVRYDLGTISAVPEEIKFSTLRHGVGAEFALDTPVGQAAIGVGKSFYFLRDLPQNPLQEGPFVFYFAIGYQP
ncbi:MAG: patatin-like phospholipase family protein [Bacteroidota bacterium]